MAPFILFRLGSCIPPIRSDWEDQKQKTWVLSRHTGKQVDSGARSPRRVFNDFVDLFTSAGPHAFPVKNLVGETRAIRRFYTVILPLVTRSSTPVEGFITCPPGVQRGVKGSLFPIVSYGLRQAG